MLASYSCECVFGFISLTHHGTIADLNGLEQMQEQLSSLAGEQYAITGLGSMADLVRQVDSLHRGHEVRDHTSETKVKGLRGSVLKAEGVLDDFLHPILAHITSLPTAMVGKTYRLRLHTSHRVRVVFTLYIPNHAR